MLTSHRWPAAAHRHPSRRAYLGWVQPNRRRRRIVEVLALESPSVAELEDFLSDSDRGVRRTAVSTLVEHLQNTVEGPRAGLAARFASAQSEGDAAELSTVSEEFEKIGDLIAAMDAAAYAAVVHRRAERRGTSLTCSARADELARRCGGASTPALLRASERLPLSDREREIVMLIREGLSTRAIAEKLTLSVRTVEGHIYRAMTKTGAVGRDELAAMLPRRSPPV